mgnify:CR=1 FL=1
MVLIYIVGAIGLKHDDEEDDDEEKLSFNFVTLVTQRFLLDSTVSNAGV